MRALVVFESMFGNTELVAEAVAAGLSTAVRVEVVEVGAAPTVIGDDVTMLVVGCPTHAFGMSRPGTRRSAAEQAEGGVVSTGIGLREWLDRVHAPAALATAAFDTRIARPPLPGSAARAAVKRLRRLGLRPIVPAERFAVIGTRGPLVDGELDRAQRWGVRLATMLTAWEAGYRPA
jgi:hypothetical protein